MQTINYHEWAHEYEKRTDVIKRHLDELKSKMVDEDLDPDKKFDLDRRVSHIYAVYLEHRAIARFLRKRGKKYEDEI